MKNQTNESLISGFSDLGIAPALLEALSRLKYLTPTPIQRQAIPAAVQGKDIVGVAQTGTGKTLAFGIPMIQRLAQVKGRGLVVLPTRELALQVDEALRRVGHGFGLKTAVLIGGLAPGPQIRALANNPHIIIATPGRLIDHLNQRTARLDAVRIVVLDEADRMLDMGFAPQIQKIFQALPANRQTMLFSATMPPEIMKMAAAHMKLPIRIEIAPAGTTAERVTQEIFVIHRDAKNRLLDKILEQHPVTTLVFTRTKYGAARLARTVRAMGHSAAELHSNRSLSQRREALDGFKSGKYRVLVATDIASRGIDVVGIGIVVNYDLPTSSEDYVHRIGRTARAGAGGRAISFVMPEQRHELRDIERLIRKTLPVSQLPELPPERRPVEAERVFYPEHRPRRPAPPRSRVSGQGQRPRHRRSFSQRRGF
ncbi:MAG: DEAD/DEAH box helicase [Parcubacteria group bacterium]|nr:DEAD/DEAH box helicase [Parcubacteria group bacterium]